MAGGRQRAFDHDDALDNAMKVFWKKGFSGASMTDLTESMGINKPSLYATYGNKEQLFIAATTHYLERYANKHFQFLEGTAPVKERLLACLDSLVRGQTCADSPKGCYISLSINDTEADTLPQAAATVINEAKDLSEKTFETFFEREIALGNLADHHDPKALAQVMATLGHGSAAMARSGKTPEEILPTYRLVIDALLAQA